MSRSRRSLAAVVALAVSAMLALVNPSASAAASAADSGARPHRWYLALGDSLAAGYQPGVGEDRDGGYVGHVRDALQVGAPRTRLVNLACSGETTVTMVEGGVCTYGRGNQLTQAKQFLRLHRDTTRLITLDIGANDVQRCVSGVSIDPVCIEAGMADVARELPKILRTLRREAPSARIIVLNYYDPFLAAWLLGPDGQAVAVGSVALLARLNTIISTAGKSVHAKTADVATAFSSTDFVTQVTLPGFGTVPLNVARICQWTFMCTLRNIHANDAGYQVMGETVVAMLRRSPALRG